MSRVKRGPKAQNGLADAFDKMLLDFLNSPEFVNPDGTPNTDAIRMSASVLAQIRARLKDVGANDAVSAAPGANLEALAERAKMLRITDVNADAPPNLREAAG